MCFESFVVERLLDTASGRAGMRGCAIQGGREHLLYIMRRCYPVSEWNGGWIGAAKAQCSAWETRALIGVIEFIGSKIQNNPEFLKGDVYSKESGKEIVSVDEEGQNGNHGTDNRFRNRTG